jgi:hypothetical protein
MLGQATMYVSTPPTHFFDEWGRQYELDRQLTDKEALAFETYATAHSEPSIRARFVTMVTVVEVLAAGAMRSAKAQAVIDGFMDDFMERTRSSDLDQSERSSLERGLLKLKRGSIGAACRRYIKAALGKEVSVEFERLYDVRSRLVHAGVYDDTDLGDELTKLETIASGLLARAGTAAAGDS